MTAIGWSDLPVKIALPTRQEVAALLARPSVAITAIIMLGLVVLGALGGIVFLAFNGRGTEAIGALLLGVLGLVLGRLGQVQKAVQNVAASSPTVDSPLATVTNAETVTVQGIPGARSPN